MRLQRVQIIVSVAAACGILAVFALDAWIYLRPFERTLPAEQVQAPDNAAVNQLSAIGSTEAPQ